MSHCTVYQRDSAAFGDRFGDWLISVGCNYSSTSFHNFNKCLAKLPLKLGKHVYQVNYNTCHQKQCNILETRRGSANLNQMFMAHKPNGLKSNFKIDAVLDLDSFDASKLNMAFIPGSRVYRPLMDVDGHIYSKCELRMWVKCEVQYIPRNMHTVFALLCFVVVIHWLIYPYPSGVLHWHCGNLTIAPVPAKQPWWIWINTSCEFIMNDCMTTTKQSTTKPCVYFLGYT